MKYLIEAYQVDIFQKDELDQTALELAENKDQQQIITYLKLHMLEINQSKTVN